MINIEEKIELLKEAYKKKEFNKVIDVSQELLETDSLKRPQRFEALYHLGHSLKAKKNYKQAQAIFATINEEYPKRFEGLQGLFQTALPQKEWEVIIKIGDECTERFPNRFNGYYWKGLALKELGNYNESIEQFYSLQDEFPNRHEGLQGLIQVSNQQENWKKTAKLSKLFIKRYPNRWQGYHWQGHAYKNLGQYNKAKEQFDILIDRFPNRHEGFEGMVQIAKAQKNWDDVVKYAQEVIEKNPKLWTGYWNLGQAYKNLALYDKAKEQFEILQDKFPNRYHGFEGMVQVATVQKNWDDVVKYAQEVIEKNPKLWTGYWNLGQAYKNLALYDKAKEQFEILQDKFPNRHHGFEGMVQVATVQKNWDDVVKYAQEVIEKNPKLWTGYWNLGQAYKNLALYDKAREQFKLLQYKFPSIRHGWQGILDIANDKNEWQDSLEACEDALINFPEDKRFIYAKGIALKNLKSFDEAEDYFREMKVTFSSSHLPYVGLAVIYSKLRKTKDAIYELQQALIHFPNNQQIAEQLINTYLKYNEPEEAQLIFDNHITDPSNIRNELLQARIIQIAQGNSAYLDKLEELYQASPNEIPVALAYANALINLTMEEE